MSSATYPQGMNSYNNRGHTGGYKSWKGVGIFRNPIGITSGNIRPLTNADPANNYPAAFGRPRPIKHYRQGITIPVPVFTINPHNPAEIIESAYFSKRDVRSSVKSNMISQLQDQPGRFIIKDNNIIGDDCKLCKGIGIVSDLTPTNNLNENPEHLVTNPLLCCNQERKARQRVLPSSTIIKKNYYQTTYMYLYNRCQTFKQREFNFFTGIMDPEMYSIIEKYPFVSSKEIKNTNAGEPLAALNYYVAQCNPNGTIDLGIMIAFIDEVTGYLYKQNLINSIEYNYFKATNPSTLQDLISFLSNDISDLNKTQVLAILAEILISPHVSEIISGPSNPKGCKQVFYKPNNGQYAQQGAVSSSTRILKLNVDTISTNAARMKTLRNTLALDSITGGANPAIPFLMKTKGTICNPSVRR